MPINPWDYAEKSGTEHAHQAALFMWANMAMRYGHYTSMIPASYMQKDYARNYSRNAIATGNDFLIPQLKWLHAIHNQGHGDAIRGAKAKAEGVKAGVSDMFLPVPRTMWSNEEGGTGYLAAGFPIYCGLYLELKVGSNTPSEDQLIFMADMREAGYCADWAKGWLEARDKILAYLQISC